jgi:hypothetical protein
MRFSTDDNEQRAGLVPDAHVQVKLAEFVHNRPGFAKILLSLANGLREVMETPINRSM